MHTIFRTVLLAGLATPVLAQTPASARLCQALDITRGTVHRISFQATPGQPFAVSLALGGRSVTLELYPHDLRARDFAVWLDDGQRRVRAPAGGITTYQGVVRDRADSRVAASLLDGRLSARIHLPDRVYAVQSTQGLTAASHVADEYVVYDASHLRPSGRAGIGVAPVAVSSAAAPRTANSGATRTEVEIAFDCDNPFYKRFNSSATQTRDHVLSVLNSIDLIYRRDVNLQFKVTSILIRTTPVYTATTVYRRVNEMRARWNKDHGSIQRDVAHLFTGITDPTLLSFTYGRSVCTSNGYSGSRSYLPNAVLNTWNLGFTTGFAFGAATCATTNQTCYMMCRYSSGCGNDLTRFGTAAISAMNTFLSTVSCLGTVANPASYSTFGTGCAGIRGSAPTLVGTEPILGRTFYLDVKAPGSGLLTLVAFGASDSKWGAIPLPLDLKVIGAPGCSLRASPDAMLADRTDVSGFVHLKIAIPNNAAFLGIRFYNQSLVADISPKTGNITMSNAGQGVVGR